MADRVLCQFSRGWVHTISVKVCSSDLGRWQTTAVFSSHQSGFAEFDDRRSIIDNPKCQHASNCGRTIRPQLRATHPAAVRPAFLHSTASCSGALVLISFSSWSALVFCDRAIICVEGPVVFFTPVGPGHLRARCFTPEALCLPLFKVLIVIDDLSVNLIMPGLLPRPWHLCGATSRPRAYDPPVSWLGAPHPHGAHSHGM